MSNKETKVKSLSFEVIRNVSMMLLVVNLIVIANIAFWVTYSIEKSEKQYMSEVIARVSGEMNLELQRYIDASYGISVNAVIRDYLTQVDNVGLVANPEYDQAVREELAIIANIFDGVVLHACAGSVASDNIVDHTGGSGGQGFSMKNQPYYSAITQQQLTITDAYADTSTGQTIVTMAVPVYGESGEILGLVALDLLVEKLSSFVTDTSFGTSGTTFILDKNDTILVYPASASSDSTSSTSYQGEELQRELANPTGEIIKFTSGGVARMGGIATIENAGWRLVSAMDVADFQARATMIVTALSGMQVLFFLGGIVLSGRFIYKKLRPIKLIQNYMHEISEGNLQSTLEYESDDEMGALVGDIQSMVATLFTYINHVAGTIHDFAEGKIQISQSVEYIGDFKPVHDSMEDFVTLMSGSLSDLRRAVHEVGSGAHQISNGAEVLANGAQEQAASVEQLNALISHVNDEITETAKYSGKIAGYAGNITDDIQKNNEKMKDLATNVQLIKDHSDEVKRIIKAIEDVAFQTNILALNAAVEAARAGESGRGFAVVADEVRNLSLKTSEAVKDTTKIITEMATFVESSTDLAHETSKDLQQIVVEAEGFVDNMAKISHSTNDQSNAISDIHKGIEQISNVVHQNAAISEESSASTEQLSTQASMMTELIEKFKLD